MVGELLETGFGVDFLSIVAEVVEEDVDAVPEGWGDGDAGGG